MKPQRISCLLVTLLLSCNVWSWSLGFSRRASQEAAGTSLSDRDSSERMRVLLARRPVASNLARRTALHSFSPKHDYQSDALRFGRGEMHLSALLDEGDVVIYQTGNWLVDGVRVGEDDSPPSLQYARVDTIQIVWTHNCEHGVVRGTSMVKRDETTLVSGDEFVQFGPEQLLARLAVLWDVAGNECQTASPVDEDKLILL